MIDLQQQQGETSRKAGDSDRTIHRERLVDAQNPFVIAVRQKLRQLIFAFQGKAQGAYVIERQSECLDGIDVTNLAAVDVFHREHTLKGVIAFAHTRRLTQNSLQITKLNKLKIQVLC